MTTSVTRSSFTTPDLQDQDQDHSVQDQDRLFWSQTGLVLKTDGLRPHHWIIQLWKRTATTIKVLFGLKRV